MMIAVQNFEKRFLTGHPTLIAFHLVVRIFYDCRFGLRSRIRQTLSFDLSRRASMLPSIAALDRSTKNIAEN
jgi:hypothetical protein